MIEYPRRFNFVSRSSMIHLFPNFSSLLFSFFTNVFVPNLRMRRNESFHQLTTLAIVEVDDFHAVFTQPVQAAGEGAAVTDHKRSDSELAHQTTAVPARSKRSHHHQIAITRLAACAAKSVSLAMNAGIALLHAAIAAPAEHLALTRKQGRAHGNAALAEADARLFNGHRQHLFTFRKGQRHKSNLNQRVSISGPARRFGATGRAVELQPHDSASCYPEKSFGASALRKHQLAEMASFFHAFQSLTHLAPIELFSHRAQLGQRNSLVHLQKILARTDVDTMNARRFVKNKRNRNRLRGLCEQDR